MAEATAAHLAALTLPATLPGVLRKGTPVVPTEAGVWHEPRSGRPGRPCSATAASVARGAPMKGYDSVYLCDWGNTPIAACNVDLTDATGRAHVAWAIAAHCAHPTSLARRLAPIDPALVCWRYNSSPCDRGEYAWDLSWEARRTRVFRRGTMPISESRRGLYFVPQPLVGGWPHKVIPSLVGLDPCDDTRLPDGSRWVDAEALRLVALDVLGTA